MRDALVAEMRVHKKKRDELQKKAKELIEFKKKIRGKQVGGLRDEIKVTQQRIKDLELRQETVPMPIPEERKLLEELKHKLADLEKLRTILSEQEKIQSEVQNIDQSIDDLFKLADKEHKEVVRLSNEAQKHHDDITELVKEISTLIAAANKKHDDFKKMKEEADAAHVKAMEMRDKILEIKRVKRAERMEEVRALKQVNLATRRALDDKDKKDKAAEDALQALLKKGKLELG